MSIATPFAILLGIMVGLVIGFILADPFDVDLDEVDFDE